MNVRQVLLDAGLNVFGADLLAESFLKSPIAKQALEKGDPVRFFLPVRRSDCAEFVGVEISIAAVPVEVTANVVAEGPPGGEADGEPASAACRRSPRA
jgi:hypothetical protein